MARKTARLGRQTPTQALVLPYDETKGGEAVELYEQGGRTAMDWQKVLLYDMMAVDDDGLWVHSKFGLSVPRRNGKSEVDKMRELWGLFHSEHILHTAHRTAKHSAWIFTNVSLTGEDRERRQGRRKKKISTHVPLAGDDVGAPGRRHDPGVISIHVPLAGDDQRRCWRDPLRDNFYPRPPLRGTTRFVSKSTERFAFLSTSPLRGTTGTTCARCAGWRFLSTSPLRGTTIIAALFAMHQVISIHVPLAGDDRCVHDRRVAHDKFLSTSPLRGTTPVVQHVPGFGLISIHVPLAGDDLRVSSAACGRTISIHVPLAGDDYLSWAWAWQEVKFLSTSPLRGTTPSILR